MANDKDLKVQNLNDQIDYMRDLITDLLRDQEIAHEEIRYLSDFISYKKLDEEYRYFRENAHEEYEEDLPFPILTL
jgi:hypothetical protein